MVTRSVSAPHLQQSGTEQLVPGLEDLQRFRRWDQTLRNLHKTSRDSWNENKDCPVSIVEQIFTFVAGSPDRDVRNNLFSNGNCCLMCFYDFYGSTLSVILELCAVIWYMICIT